MRRRLRACCVAGYPALLALTVAAAGAQDGSRKAAAPGAPLPTIASSSPVVAVDDPSADGWVSEVFSQAAAAQLNQLGALLARPEPIVPSAVAVLLADGFSSTALRPTTVVEVFRDEAVVVRRGEPSLEEGAEAEAERHHGPPGFAAALGDLRRGLGEVHGLGVKVKVVGVDRHDSEWTSELLLEIAGSTASGAVEQHARWRVGWSWGSRALPPLMRRLELRDWEESRTTTSSGRRWFIDATAAVLGGNASYAEQLLVGTADWLGTIEAAIGTDFIGHAGVAVGDVNGDGLEDLYVPQFGGLPNRLFVQNLDGTASDRSAWAGVDWLDRSLSSLLIDLDNDGDEDLVLSTGPALVIMANDGAGRFTLERRLSEVRLAYSLAAADYDQDGDLDLYATGYSPLELQRDHIPKPIPYHDAENGAPNYLLRNDGDWRFVDVTAAVGLDVDNRRWSFAASWEDYDNDGDADLYVANDFGRNNLYRNDGDHFVNVAAAAGVEDIASGMSVAWGDANRDGLMDLYVGNMFSSAGNRITYQGSFQPGMSASDRARVQRLARGSSLFLNRGDGVFADVSLEAGVTMGRWAWSSIFADLNNDGWKDLVVANGFLTASDPDDL